MTLDELKALAQKATPGPWESVPVMYAGSNGNYGWAESEGRLVNGPPQRVERDTLSARWFERKQDGDYIAALSPERVLALIACVEAADAMRMSHAGYNRSVDDNCNDEMRAIRYTYDAARAALEKP